MFFSSFFHKHKSKILPLIPVLTFVFLVFGFWGKWGNVLTDCFREVIIPSGILDGKILYKEITSIYPPAAYQVNAFFVFLFKDGLNLFYWLGILASFAVLLTLYKTAKCRSSSLTALAITLSVIEIFVFKVDAVNSASWIFPYSYSFLYAFLFCILAFYFYFEYKRTNKNKALCLTFLMTGVSAAFKYDFLLFLIMPVFETLKNKSPKQLLKGMGLFFAPSVFSFLIYVISGGNIAENLKGLSIWADFLVNFSQAPSVLIFNKNILQQTITPVIVNFAIRSFLIFALCALVLSVYLYFSLVLFEKIKNKLLKGLLFVPFLLIAFFLILRIAAAEYSNFGIDLNFIFVPYFVILSAFAVFCSKFKEKNYTDKEKFYIAGAIASLFIIFRQFGAVLISYIGNFLIVIPWFLFIYFWLEILPEYFSFFKTKNAQRAIALFFVLFGLSFLLFHLQTANKMEFEIKSTKGKIYTSAKYGTTFNEAVDYINKNVTSDESVLVAFEGPILNYLTNRKTNLKYYALIPHITEALGEENIVEDLSKEPPDYIFVTNEKYIFIGRFGLDYGVKIQEFINSNYDPVQTLPSKGTSDFKISIYKKR